MKRKKHLASRLTYDPTTIDREKVDPSISYGFPYPLYRRAQLFAWLSTDNAADRRRMMWEFNDGVKPVPNDTTVEELIRSKFERYEHLSCGKKSCFDVFSNSPIVDIEYVDEDCCPLCQRRIHKYPASIASDTGWESAATSIHQRGIHDYVRRIEFSPEATRQEINATFEYMKEHDCPGWTGLGIRPGEKLRSYVLTTTYDSSD